MNFYRHQRLSDIALVIGAPLLLAAVEPRCADLARGSLCKILLFPLSAVAMAAGRTAVFPVMTHSARGMKCFASTAVDDRWLSGASGRRSIGSFSQKE
jgi:hypothetical protein